MALTSRELRAAYNNGNYDFEILSSQIEEALGQENLSNNQRDEIEKLKKEIEQNRVTANQEESSNKQQEAEEVAATPNNQDHDEFKKAKNNEERRKIVKKEFLTGELTHQEHIDFFIEQFAKNQLGIDKENEETRSKLENILGGKEGILQRRETLLKSIVSNSLNTYTTTASGMAPVIGKDDFGLSVAKDDVTKKSNKTEFDELMAEADRLALLKRELGTERKEDVAKREEILRKNLKEFQSGEKKLKWYQFRRQRRLNKADEKLDPIRYWNEQRQHNGDSLYVQFMHSRAIWRAKKRTNNTEKYKEKLNNVIEAKAIDASIGWFSKRVGKKIKAKTTILFSRSPEKLLEKFKQNATVSDMAEYQKELQAKLTSKKESYNPDIYTTSERAEQEQYTKYYGGFAEKLEEAAKQKRNDVDNLEKGMKGTKHSSDKPEMVVGNLKSKLEQVKRSFEQAEKDDIVLKAWNNFHDANSDETGKFSDDQILQIICDQSGFANIDGLLRSMGIQENKVSELKEQILGKQKDEKPTNPAPTEQEYQQENQSENVQTSQAKVKTVDNVPEGSKQVAETAFYQSGKNEYVYNKQAVSGGENPLTSKTDHIKTLLRQLRDQNVTDIEITGFDDSMAKAFKDVLESDEFKDVFNVTNKEQFDEQVKNAEKVDESHDKNDDKKVGGETQEETLEEVVLEKSDEQKQDAESVLKVDREPHEETLEENSESIEENNTPKSKDDIMKDIIKKHENGDITDEEMKTQMQLVLSTNEVSKGKATNKDSDYSKKMKEIDSSELTKDEKQTLKDGVVINNLYDEQKDNIEGIKTVNEMVTDKYKNIKSVQDVASRFTDDKVKEDDEAYQKLSPSEQQMVKDICNIRQETTAKAEKEFGKNDPKVQKAREAAELLVVKDAITQKFAGGKRIIKNKSQELSNSAIAFVNKSQGNSK